jgi:hypothetical protein
VHSAQRRFLILACAAACSSAAAEAPALTIRIREHMREYVAHLPDYTCRITLERFKRPKARAGFEPSDRLRLEVAYTGGQELYSWPGEDRFEGGIEDLLPGHGMVSNGSYALHVRNLFLRDVAEFGAPREEKCEGGPCVRLDFRIPALRSGYALSAGTGSAPAPLVGAAWFDAASLDIVRLEVRVDEAPRAVRIAATRESTVYVRARIGEVEFVVPGVSELWLRDRDGSELLNRSRFDQYHRYAGSATVSYAPVGDAPVAVAPARAPSRAAAPRVATQVATQVTAALDGEIGEDAAIGDGFTATTADGVQVGGRITDMRRVGKGWLVELTVSGMVRRGLALPLKAGTKLMWKAG